MSFFKRMISPSYRRAVAAEAGGNYLEAARAFALAGLPEKVAEMHLLEADRSTTEEERLDELRAAVHFAEGAGTDRNEVRLLLQRISHSYLNLLRRGVITERDRALAQTAGRLALLGGDPLAAATAYELIGDEQGAAEAYKEAGELEHLEAVLSREEHRRRGQSDERDHFEVYKMNLHLGRRDLALLSLRKSVQAAPQKEDRQRLLAELGEKMLVHGQVTLRWQERGADGAPFGPAKVITYVGSFPLVLGRGAECQVSLRDAGISRAHASIGVVSGGPAAFGGPGVGVVTFAVRDLKSRNGTTLNQLPIAGELALRGEGEIGIGEACALSFEIEGPRLALTVIRGMDRGRQLWASPVPMILGAGTGLTLSFPGGRPHLRGVAGQGLAMSLNGERVGGDIQLLLGDMVQVGDVSYEVLS